MRPLRLLLTAAVVSLCASVAFAQQMPVKKLAGDDRTTGAPTLTNIPKNLPFVHGSVAALNGINVFDSIINSFSYFSMSTTPMWYDSASKLLVTIKRGNPAQSGNKIFIRTSTDLGTTWSAPIGPLFDPAGAGLANGRYPSVCVLNPTRSTDPAQIYYYYSVPILVGGAFGSVAYGLRGADGTELIAATPSNGVGVKKWSTTTKFIVSTTSDVVVAVDLTDSNSVGLRRVDVNSASYTEFIPPQFDGSLFTPSTDPASRTSTVAGAGRDNADRFYVALHTRFPSTDAEKIDPRPCFSVSTDKGATWGALNILPKAAINTYIAANMAGANPDSVGFGYTNIDFKVRGNNKVSFIGSLSERDASKTSTVSNFVEVIYEGNNWSIRKIGDWSGFWIAPNDTASSNQVENELSVSTTADGSVMLAKWAELMNYVFSADIDGDGMSPDTLRNTTDIFVSASKNGGAWSKPLNVTGDALLNHITHIPQVIPNDLSKVPMIFLLTDWTGATNYKDSIWNKQRDFTVSPLTHYVCSATFDATPALGVKDITDVNSSGLRLNAPYPNPVKDRALVTFTLPTAGRVKIDLFDIQGRMIRTIADEATPAGNRGIVMNTGDLASGTYYYTLTVNGQSISKMFNIVK